MKILIFTILFTFAGLAGTAQTNVNITFDGNSTPEYMQNQKNFLMENGYLFNIMKMNFSKSGTLSELSFRVITPDGKEGTASSVFDGKGQKLQIVNNTDNGNFCVGNCQ